MALEAPPYLETPISCDYYCIPLAPGKALWIPDQLSSGTCTKSRLKAYTPFPGIIRPRKNVQTQVYQFGQAIDNSYITPSQAVLWSEHVLEFSRAKRVFRALLKFSRHGYSSYLITVSLPLKLTHPQNLRVSSVQSSEGLAIHEVSHEYIQYADKKAIFILSLLSFMINIFFTYASDLIGTTTTTSI
ncbi:uncharacterized protein BDR25DRAFT_362677 [Lindgomyces ingoldianus]|uniref:Uncharacterized protein n=1 Tax=Lindgomyces ingoldianus TaxID=673940 RepID=A0ACB6Q978_9PLEO|nr:uncharacterized protein BDR25DRAFT_362677 [Lindgomyces ingoldianus]KAF2463504.1 hypothetical protein BDR25DRAFT_362677 [Lindgomyces ingoldianus]